MNKFLFKQIDNIGLVLFRVAFGALISIQSFGELATGWARRTLVEPEFTFNFIGFDFIQPLPGNWMYVYCALMGVFGLLVMVGYKYRISMFSYALMWTCIYLMQKTSYNNHYYLMMLLCWIFVFLPAHHWFSLDSHFNKKIKKPYMPRWVLLIIILQIWIVYTYASVAKWYPDWLDGTVAALFMSGKSDYPIIGEFLQLEWVHWSITYVGILFDLLIVPLMLWKRTRLAAFLISIFFHVFNSIVFQIGIFPYMSIAFALFFFSPELLQKRILPKKPLYKGDEVIVPNYRNALLGVLSVYFVIQILLPLRHWTIQDDVLWTEEGHRLSWRMMLRSKSARLKVWIEDKETGTRIKYDYIEMLSKKQRRSVKAKPDMLWQLAQRIKEKGAAEGKDLGVYMDVKVKVNGGVYHQFIKPDVDLAAEEWNHFGHHDWIEPSPVDYHQNPKQEEALRILNEQRDRAVFLKPYIDSLLQSKTNEHVPAFLSDPCFDQMHEKYWTLVNNEATSFRKEAIRKLRDTLIIKYLLSVHQKEISNVICDISPLKNKATNALKLEASEQTTKELLEEQLSSLKNTK